MRELNRTLFPVVAVALMAVAAWWTLGERSAPEVAGPPVEEAQTTYYVHDFHLRATGEAGRTRYRVQGPRAAYYEDADTWRFTQPRWTLKSREGPVWMGRAERGRAWNDTTEAELRGDVRLRREGAGEGPVTLRTERIYLQPQRRYAETDSRVRIDGPGYRVDGRGARAWFDRQRLELLADVEGRYAPPL